MTFGVNEANGIFSHPDRRDISGLVHPDRMGRGGSFGVGEGKIRRRGRKIGANEDRIGGAVFKACDIAGDIAFSIFFDLARREFHLLNVQRKGADRVDNFDLFRFVDR